MWSLTRQEIIESLMPEAREKYTVKHMLQTKYFCWFIFSVSFCNFESSSDDEGFASVVAFSFQSIFQLLLTSASLWVNVKLFVYLDYCISFSPFLIQFLRSSTVSKIKINSRKKQRWLRIFPFELMKKTTSTNVKDVIKTEKENQEVEVLFRER